MLILIHSLRGGGAGRMCAFLANGLYRRGWQVTVTVSMVGESRWEELFAEGVSLRFLNTGHARRSVGALIAAVREHRPQTVVAFNYQVAVLLPIIRRLSGVPFRSVGRTVVALSAAAQFKGFWQREIVMRFVRRRYRKLDAVIAQSAGMIDDLRDNFRVPRERIHVIHNPATVPDQRVVSGGRRADAYTLLYLGRFKPQKQPCFLVDLIAALQERTLPKRVVLIAAGEGPLVESFTEYARSRGVSEAIEYCGYVTDIEPLYARADATVLMSAYEGFPNVLVESIARGIPVVSFDCPTGPSEIVSDGENGKLVPLNDLDAFVEATVDVLTSPPPHDRVLATAARFRPEVILDRYEEVLRGE